MRFLLVAFLASACAAPSSHAGGSLRSSGVQGRSVVLAANWKERLEQPYLFIEVTGDRRSLAEAFERLEADIHDLRIRPDGAPFALLFDGRAGVGAGQQRARACCPVQERPQRAGSLRFAVLERAMVVYGRVQGPHATVARSYPALFSYMYELGGRQCGPLREVYLGGTRTDGTIMDTEIQIPWSGPGQ